MTSLIYISARTDGSWKIGVYCWPRWIATGSLTWLEMLTYLGCLSRIFCLQCFRCVGDKQDCFKIYLPDLLLVSVSYLIWEPVLIGVLWGLLRWRRLRWRNGDHPKQIKVRLNGPSCRQLRGHRCQSAEHYLVFCKVLIESFSLTFVINFKLL